MNGELTKSGKRYFMTFIDDYTRFCYVYLLKSKDEALHYFKTYKAEVENQLERKIKRLRSNRGGEYFSSKFSKFCIEHEIIHESTQHGNMVIFPRNYGVTIKLFCDKFVRGNTVILQPRVLLQ
jgi:transposase InsO family protein